MRPKPHKRLWQRVKRAEEHVEQADREVGRYNFRRSPLSVLVPLTIALVLLVALYFAATG